MLSSALVLDGALFSIRPHVKREAIDVNTDSRCQDDSKR
jgi:hypothetical protein